jgi:tetratricopeptide (TPR) repeat protein
VSDLTPFQERLEALTEALEGMDLDALPAERSALKREIVALYQELDALVGAAVRIREGVQALGERYRRSFAPGEAAGGGGAARGAAEVAEAAVMAGMGEGPEMAEMAEMGDGAMARADDLDVSTYLDRAWNCLATCRYEDALEEVGRALVRVPASLQAETLRGWALMRLGRLYEAREVLEDVLRTNSSAALARASLGYVAYREGRYSESIDHLSRASRDATDRKAVLYAHLYLGMLYTRREMFRDGRSFLTRALELGPSLVEAYWEMGRSYYLEGQFTQAVGAWRRGAEVNRFDPWGERCQEAVERATSGGTVELD